MRLTDVLVNYIGRPLEVYQRSQFVQGNLLAVGLNNITIRETSPHYYDPDAETTILISSIEMIRVIP